MKNMKKLVAVLMTVMVLALAVPAVFAEEAQPEQQPEVSAPVKAEEPEKTQEPEKVEETKAPEAEAPAEKPEATEAPAEPEATAEATAEPAATPEVTTEPEATAEPTAEPTPEVTAGPEATAEPTAEPTPEVTVEPEATAEPTVEPTPDATPINRSVEVEAEDSSLQVGDTLKLTAKLTGFEGVKYTLTWQVMVPGEDWKNIDGENGETLKVELSEENIGASWRVAVETEE